MRKIIYISLLLLFSCADGTQKNNHSGINIDSKGKIEQSNFLLSSIVDNFSFVELETNDNSLLQAVDKVIIKDDLIFVLDKDGNNQVLVFDINGKYIRKIGNIGAGPGEYQNVSDFCIDNNLIYILSDLSLYVYNHDGIFLEKIKLDFNAANIEFFKDKFFFICGIDNYIIVTDDKFNVLTSDFPLKNSGANVDDVTGIPIDFRLLINPMLRTDSSLVFRRFLDNHVYKIDENLDTDCQYYFDFGEKSFSIESSGKFTREADFKEKMANSRCHVKYLTEDENYILYIFFDENIPCLGVYDKSVNKTEMYHYEKLVDDITNISFPIFEYSTKNEIIAVINPMELSKEEIIEMNKIGVNINNESNPILYIVKTKKRV